MRKKSLERLKGEGLPRATCETVGIDVSGKDEVEGRRIMDKYFRSFVCPKSTECENGSSASGSHKCVACGERIDGIIGTFQWGLASGEGQCCRYGYLMRGMHYIKDDQGEDFMNLTRYILQYHPDELHKKEETTDADSL